VTPVLRLGHTRVIGSRAHPPHGIGKVGRELFAPAIEELV
jgi:hypothetical protein